MTEDEKGWAELEAWNQYHAALEAEREIDALYDAHFSDVDSGVWY